MQRGFLSKVTSELRAIFEECLLKDESLLLSSSRPVVAALSGGTDSTALLMALHLVAPELNLQISACHVNHGLRAAESALDQGFCQSLCASLEIPLKVFEEEPRTEGDCPSEERLRTRRYELLVEAARQFGSAFIVAGHTLDDQVETVLFRLFRGASLSGLSGMKRWRHLSGEGVVLARPLLSHTRGECLEFLADLNVKARSDSSNNDQRFARNYLRHSVLPAIEARFPNARVQLERFRQQVEREDGLLDRQCERLLDTVGGVNASTWSISALAAEDPALVGRALARGLAQRGIAVTFERIALIFELMGAESTARALSLNQIFDIRKEDGRLFWLDKTLKPRRVLGDQGLILRVPGTMLVPALGRALKIEEYSPAQDEPFPAQYSLTIIGSLADARLPLTLRHRRPGDLIQPFGMDCSISLKRYLHTHKPQFAPAWLERVETVVVADGDQVLWVPAVGLSERLRVRAMPCYQLSWLDLAQDVTIV